MTEAAGDLAGQRTLITGATAGIGLATAFALGRHGAQVLVGSRSEHAGGAAVSALRAEGLAADLVIGDAGTSEGCRQIAGAADQVDILINNVGIYPARRFFDSDDSHWDEVLRVNLLSGVRLSRALVPAMIRAGHGRVIFVSSDAAVAVLTELIAYSVSKTAQVVLARGLAQEVAGTGVTVNSVLAGPTRTAGLQAELDDLAREMSTADGTTPLGADAVEREFMNRNKPGSLIRRLLDPAEVAAMIGHLCAPEGAATTGAAIRVDGGLAPTFLP